jgi:hypothetical protein
MDLWEEFMLIDGLIEDYKRQAEAAGEDPEYSGGYEGPQYAPSGELLSLTSDGGTAVRTFEGKVSDGTAKPYYPSAARGDRMATGEELQELFGVTYVDERDQN